MSQFLSLLWILLAVHAATGGLLFIFVSLVRLRLILAVLAVATCLIGCADVQNARYIEEQRARIARLPASQQAAAEMQLESERAQIRRERQAQIAAGLAQGLSNAGAAMQQAQYHQDLMNELAAQRRANIINSMQPTRVDLYVH
jgi:hypothetical protein